MAKRQQRFEDLFNGGFQERVMARKEQLVRRLPWPDDRWVRLTLVHSWKSSTDKLVAYLMEHQREGELHTAWKLKTFAADPFTVTFSGKGSQERTDIISASSIIACTAAVRTERN